MFNIKTAYMWKQSSKESQVTLFIDLERINGTVNAPRVTTYPSLWRAETSLIIWVFIWICSQRSNLRIWIRPAALRFEEEEIVRGQQRCRSKTASWCKRRSKDSLLGPSNFVNAPETYSARRNQATKITEITWNIRITRRILLSTK